MIRIKSFTPLACALLLLTGALNQGLAQGFANLPDEPGLTV
jgi:hypothetical protein